MENKNPLCPKCGSNTSKDGFAYRKGGKVQSYTCHDKGHVFVETQIKTVTVPAISKPKKLAEKGHSLI